MCFDTLTRRQALRYAALVTATLGVSGAARAEARPLDRLLHDAVVPGAPAVPMNLELVTVSDTYAVATWLTADPTDVDEFGRPRPVAAPGRLLLGTSPDPRTWVEVAAHGPTPFHVAEVRGLRPGTRYWWRAESGGLAATPAAAGGGSVETSMAAPPWFDTLVPPPGREIGRVAWINDLHFGETVAGLAYSDGRLPGGGLPPGFPVDEADPYWRFMSEGAIREAKQRGATLLLANGDITAEARPHEVAEARRVLDVFGPVAASRDLRPSDAPTWFATRGNHDRVHTGATYASCEASDCYREAFAGSYDAGSTHWSVRLGTRTHGYRFVGLDSNDGATTGVLRPAELAFLEAELQRGDLVVPLFHHPASENGGAGLGEADATAFRQLLGRHRDTVGGVYAGHTHRNDLSTSSETGTLPYFEGGAVKEYPGGWTLVRLFEGGYLTAFHATTSPKARAWAERTRGEYLGLAPLYQLGGLGDRCWTYEVDARRRRRARAAWRTRTPG